MALATMMSVEAPRPKKVRPVFSIRIVTVPMASKPSLMDWTLKSTSLVWQPTTRSMALHTASTGPLPVEASETELPRESTRRTVAVGMSWSPLENWTCSRV